jgi:hypothetical protein
MGKNITQISNTAATLLDTDLMYLGRSPFGVSDDYKLPGSVLNNKFVKKANLGYVTVGTSNADYVNIGAAVAANQYNMIVITAIAESADVQFLSSGDYRIVFLPNTSVNMSSGGAEWQFKRLNGVTANLVFENMTVLYSYSTSKACLENVGSGAGNLTLRNFRIVNTSTSNACPFCYSPSGAINRQLFERGIIELPNYSGGGLDSRNAIINDIEFISGGSSCVGALVAFNTSITDAYFKGSEWGSSAVINLENCGVNGLYGNTTSGTPLIYVDANEDASLSNVFGYNGALFAVTLLSKTSLNQFDLGGSGSSFTISSSSTSCSVSNGTADSAILASGAENSKVCGVKFTSTADLSIEANGALLSNVNFAGNCLLFADNIAINGFTCGQSGGSTYTLKIANNKKGCVAINGFVEKMPVTTSTSGANKWSLTNWSNTEDYIYGFTHQISADATQASNTGTGEQTLATITVPDNTFFNNGDTINLSGMFQSIGGVVAGNNTLRFKVDGTTVGTLTMTSMSVAVGDVSGDFSVKLTKSDSNQLDICCKANARKLAGSTNVELNNTQQAVFLTDPFDIVLTAECDEADATITYWNSSLDAAK